MGFEIGALYDRKLQNLMLKHGPVFLAYLLIAAFRLWPLLDGLDSVFPVGPDWAESFWKFWWNRKSIIENGASPFWCDQLFYPQGISLFVYNPCVLFGVISIPFLALANSPAELLAISNACLFATFPLTCVLAYLLCYRVTRSRLGAFFGGYVFGYSSHRITELTSLNLLSDFWLPAFLLVVILFRQRNTNAIFHGFLAGISLIGCLLSSLTGMMLILMTIPFLLVDGFLINPSNRGHGVELRLWASTVLTALLLVLILAAMTPLQAFSSDGFRQMSARQSGRVSAELGGLVRPGADTLVRGLIGIWAQDWARPKSIGDFTNRQYLGIFALIWAIFGLRFLPFRKMWYIPFMLLAAVILSMGNHIELRGDGSFRIPMPYEYLRQLIPPLRFFRTPYRFLYLASLMVAVLAAFGVGGLCRYRPSRPPVGRIISLIPFMLLPTLLIDTYQPLNLRAFDMESDALEWVRQNAGPTASVLILPASSYSEKGNQRALQVLIDKPIPIAPIARATLSYSKVISESADLERLIRGEYGEINSLCFAELSAARIGTIIVLRQHSITNGELAALIRRDFPEPAMEDERYLIYRVGRVER